jgi:lysophospholipase L1-like esterase
VRARQAAWRLRAALDGELLYVAIGDSAAQGIGARMPSGYVSRLAERLDRASGRSVRTVNLSRYGARLDDAIAEQLPRLAALENEPDLVTVAVGANDMRHFDPARFAASLDVLLASLPEHAIVADLPCFHFGPREGDAVVASRMIESRVRAAGLVFAPLHRVTEVRRGWGSFPEFAWDQFHPSAIGYRVWESAFAGAVTRRGKALRRA